MYKIKILCRQYSYALFKCIIAVLFFVLATNASLAQTIKLKKSNISYDQIFREIKKQTGYDVVLISGRVQSTRKTDVNFSNTPLKDVLETLLNPLHLEYVIQNKTIVIRERSAEPVIKEQTPPDVRGRVLNEKKEPLAGATVTIQGTSRSVVTDKDGNFLMPNVNAGQRFIISFIGYNTQAFVLQANQTIMDVQMVVAQNNLTDVVVTGTGINRKRESFTGAAETFSGDKLKSIGNKNIFESLKTLDPAFITLENNVQGSNPNTPPSIEIRGKTTISNANLNDQYSANPNQPLFILDGFESDLQTIYDLDMNRVASITLLKDAASTALYGAKASNGVVVVETKKPIPGQLQINYTADLSFDLPDLRSYNLMNASEKLQFEKLSGIYAIPYVPSGWTGDSTYNARLAAVASGVNTDWLSIPVHMGFTERHSIQMAGGSKELLFQAGVNYRDQNGVMKGSDRNTWSGNINLAYRKGKINVSNILTVSNLVSNESPYGAFSNFAMANPYYPKTNADGSLSPFMDPGPNTAPNPLYNASLFSINRTKSFGVNENLQAIYTFSKSFRLQGGVSLAKTNNDGVIFIPPDNTLFVGSSTYLQGNYTNNLSGSNTYSAFMMASYARVIGKNQITANIRGDMHSGTTSASSFQAVGFPYGTDGNPAFAYSYPTGGRPIAATTTLHTTGILGSINYSYDERYLLDATYRLDGSSTFGSNNLYQPFFAVGLGWNLHREDFLKSVMWINLLKLRANIGYTGNENLGQFTSQSVYTFLQGANLFGQGLTLTSLGNPNLSWQNTLQKSYGADFQFLDGRISGYLEYFDKSTDPLAIVANGALPSSTGVNANYVLNVGNLTTRGYDFNVHVSPIYDLKNRIIWTIGATGQKAWSRYGSIGNKLSALNKLEENSNGLIRYQDGNSPDDIWAVVSKGIDPATGNEIFQKKDGSLTFTYDPADIVKVGNTQPSIQGVLSTSLTYKNFSAGVNIRYSLNGYGLNNALYNKVENISTANLIYNQDKRALYDRWQQPGDVSQFKAISLRTSTPISSRFVEKDNHFDGESFNISYRMTGAWLKNLGMQTLNLSAYANEIFRIESIRSERGTSYPFARTVAFSLNASF
jgi:TonB-linked SusC/RagA family outer membrane protein